MINSKKVFCLSLAVFLTICSMFTVNIPWIIGEEGNFIPILTGVKKKLNKSLFKNTFYDNDYIKNHFLIINTTKDQELTVDDNNIVDTGPGIPITNRNKLFKLFKILNTDTSLYDFIVCDIMFERQSIDKKNDDSLQYYINELEIKNKIIFGIPYNNQKEFFENSKLSLDESIIGSTTKETTSDYYFKHRLLFQNEIKSLPFLLYQKKHSTDAERTFLPGVLNYTFKEKESYFYNSFIPEILFDRSEFNELYNSSKERFKQVFDSSMAICDLGTVASDSSGIYLQSLLFKINNKKTVFIGAITGEHTDKHKTLYGQTDGAIILLNTFYCIELGNNKFSIWYILVSLLFFLFISYKLLYAKKKNEEKKETLLSFLASLIIERLYYLTLLLLTLISYFAFNHTTNIIVLLLLIEFLNFLFTHLSQYKIIKRNSA